MEIEKCNIYIEDVIKFIIRSPHLSPGIYNLGGNDYSSVLDTANQIANYFGGKVKTIGKTGRFYFAVYEK